MSFNIGLDGKPKNEIIQIIKEKRNMGFVGVYNILEHEKMKGLYLKAEK